MTYLAESADIFLFVCFNDFGPGLGGFNIRDFVEDTVKCTFCGLVALLLAVVAQNSRLVGTLSSGMTFLFTNEAYLGWSFVVIRLGGTIVHMVSLGLAE